MKYLDELDIPLWERVVAALEVAQRGLEPFASSEDKSAAYVCVHKILMELQN